MGGKLLQHQPAMPEVVERIAKLEQEQLAVERALREKEDWLRQCLDLQCFNQEADHIDSTTSIHEAFLEFTEMGVSILQ